jgi:hypothetical protein
VSHVAHSQVPPLAPANGVLPQQTRLGDGQVVASVDELYAAAEVRIHHIRLGFEGGDDGEDGTIIGSPRPRCQGTESARVELASGKGNAITRLFIVLPSLPVV